MAPGQVRYRIGARLDPAGRAPGPDAIAASLAYSQHGVAARRQLLARGVTARQISRRLEAGRLHLLYRSVYAVGHRQITRFGQWMAATLACGDEAVLGHRSAAELWGMIDPIAGPIHVSVPRGSCGPHRGLIVHRHRVLTPLDRATHRSIPVTDPSRTLLDISGSLGPAALRDAVDAAHRRRLLDQARVLRLCETSRGRRGSGRLRELVARYRPLPETDSRLEQRFLRILDDAGVERPAVRVPLLGFEVDCLWEAARLVVELDGRSFHSDPETFEADRRRDATLQLAGYRVLRFTHRRLTSDGPGVIAELRAGLGGR